MKSEVGGGGGGGKMKYYIYTFKNTRFREKLQNFKFWLLIFWKSDMSSTHCFICTENRSICHGVVRL